MKRILLPTDFSDTSANAVHYAVAMTAQMPLHLELVHYYHSIRQTGHFKSLEPVLKEDAKRDMQTLLAAITPMLHQDSTVEANIYQGDASQRVAAYAKDSGADLIITGTSGSSAVEEIFLGSTTLAIIRQATVPVLAIPKDAGYRTPKRLVMAIDGVPMDAETVDPMVALAKVFGSDIYVFHADVEEAAPECPDSVSVALGDASFSYHSTVAKKVVPAIHDFTQEVNADVLVMIRRRRNLWQKIFTQSRTKKEFFQTDIPILILHEKE